MNSVVIVVSIALSCVTAVLLVLISLWVLERLFAKQPRAPFKDVKFPNQEDES